MQQHQETLQIPTYGRGLVDLTREVAACVQRSGIRTGLCVVFCRHTSCSLVIQENADPTAAGDLERWFERLAPDGDPFYRHTAEGPDDMPAHIRSVLTANELTIPVRGGRLALGTWQGIYLWEHRHSSHRRRCVVHVGE